MVAPKEPGEWVLLTYRLPREPSTPRSSVWRKLRRLGVAQLSDGLVALPADARTREQLGWIAEEILRANGTALLWEARPSTRAEEDHVAAAMTSDREGEYADLTVRAETVLGATPPEQRRALRTLRSDLRQIRRRDYFAAPGRDAATAAIDQLATAVADPSIPSTDPKAEDVRR